MDATPIDTVSGIASSEASARSGLRSGQAVTGRPPTGEPVKDTVELSSEGIGLSQTAVQSRLRTARMADICAEINAGEFVTPERVDGTVERLLDALA